MTTLKKSLHEGLNRSIEFLSQKSPVFGLSDEAFTTEFEEITLKDGLVIVIKIQGSKTLADLVKETKANV